MALESILNFEKLVVWFFTHGLKVLIILVGTWVAARFCRVFFSKILRRAVKKAQEFSRKPSQADEERLKTVIKVVASIARGAVWVIALITVLPEFGVNIGPLLAGLGFGGLALGLGARSLIQDYISGFFILLEDHYRVGEEVNIAGTKGTVVGFNLRRTVLRDENQALHYIPSSQIRQASNFSRKK